MILGIESSCDETAAAVLTYEGRVLSNVIASQVPVHAKYGGVVPELASRNHVLAALPTIERALAEAGATLDDVTALAVTQGPGLIGSLLVGLQTAKAIAYCRSLPLVGVDHVEAHIHAVFVVDDVHLPAAAPRPTPPYLALAVSGGHTSLYRVEEDDATVLVAHTLDDAAGEAFDKVAKLLGLPYPGGVAIDRISDRGDANAVTLPRALPQRDRRAFSFSGLKTAARLAIEQRAGRDCGVRATTTEPPLDEQATADVAASFQEAVVELLVRKTMQAAQDLGLDQIVVAGGVAANRRLRAAFTEATADAGIGLFLTPTVYCTDNAAMVAGLGLRRLAQGAGVQGAALLALDAYANRAVLFGEPRRGGPNRG